jgi:hypothetical protein
VDVARDAFAVRAGRARVKRAHIGFESKQKWEVARWAGKAWKVGRAQQRVMRRVVGEAVVTAEGTGQDCRRLGW